MAPLSRGRGLGAGLALLALAAASPALAEDNGAYFDTVHPEFAVALVVHWLLWGYAPRSVALAYDFGGIALDLVKFFGCQARCLGGPPGPRPWMACGDIAPPLPGGLGRGPGRPAGAKGRASGSGPGRPSWPESPRRLWAPG